MREPRIAGYSALATLVALYVAGAVSDGVLRHIVQTVPLWFPIVMGLRGREIAKWAAIPCFAVWLAPMTIIWLFFLGWVKLISGTFTPIEIAMTLVVGTACLAAAIASFRWRTRVTSSRAIPVAATFTVLQLISLRVGFLPFIVRDPF